jgi:ribosomal-protein-alanine N-acetyltransferase
VENDRVAVRAYRRLGTELILTPATADDLRAIHAVEVRAFESPWPYETFAQELRNEWSSLDVARDLAGAVVAYVVYWIVEDELHILNVAVDPAHQRKGIGRELMWHIEELSLARGLTYLTLEVRVSNEAARALYESLGFEVIHRRKRYYADNDEDALVMARVIGDAAE